MFFSDKELSMVHSSIVQLLLSRGVGRDYEQFLRRGVTKTSTGEKLKRNRFLMIPLVVLQLY